MNYGTFISFISLIITAFSANYFHSSLAGLLVGAAFIIIFYTIPKIFRAKNRV
jgi:hypothetical protein